MPEPHRRGRCPAINAGGLQCHLSEDHGTPRYPGSSPVHRAMGFEWSVKARMEPVGPWCFKGQGSRRCGLSPGHQEPCNSAVEMRADFIAPPQSVPAKPEQTAGASPCDHDFVFQGVCRECDQPVEICPRGTLVECQIIEEAISEKSDAEVSKEAAALRARFFEVGEKQGAWVSGEKHRAALAVLRQLHNFLLSLRNLELTFTGREALETSLREIAKLLHY